ncbi:hypothetical protein NliqN6_6504 [Naganishia liquefaciens]|uniref:methylmalonate-semialdehyde dehydrogenase (CoA acylating) n=1 Tax=Naganishia liquefaciens TaxID=104408 RepID=A0A8H3YJE8_9TREE|nr:hypothetical protein NliqN6_6504 [Naganishia liquefaciens]
MLARSIPSTRRLRASALPTHLLRPNLAVLTPRLDFTHYSTRVADVKADEGARWQGTCTDGGETKMCIGEEWVGSRANHWFDVRDPSTQRLLTRVPQSTPEELERAAQTAAKAFKSWSRTSLLHRQQILLKYQQLIKLHLPDLARSIVLEQGKTYADALGDVGRGLQVVESLCALPNEMTGEIVEVSRDMDTYVRRSPLGVGAVICPFNFPAMIPLWSLPVAIAAGNTLLIKPSERDPGAAAILVELAHQAGVPPGVINIVHGGVDTVNFLCDSPIVKAITFVGSNTAGEHIYTRGCANGKRVQANLGAKNHAVVMPDASKEATLNALAGAAFGAAGQRCMALSVVVTVGDAGKWMPEIIDRAKNLKVANGFTDGADLGPVISPQAKAKIEKLIASCKEEGGEILLDGRGATVEGYPDGNWVGPTLLKAREGMSCHAIEIFGPVLTWIHVDTLQEAIDLINRNKYGNGTSIFTNNGATARYFERNVEAGQIGINVPIPVPVPTFAWSGNKASVLGGHSMYGKLGLEFWTQNQTVTAFWRSEDASHSKADVAMPVHN